jgi:hypothetical protein
MYLMHFKITMFLSHRRKIKPNNIGHMLSLFSTCAYLIGKRNTEDRDVGLHLSNAIISPLNNLFSKSPHVH